MITLAEDFSAGETTCMASAAGVAPFLAAEIVAHAKAHGLELWWYVPNPWSPDYQPARERACEAFLDWVDAQSQVA